jgi:uncharacterized membrane protein
MRRVFSLRPERNSDPWKASFSQSSAASCWSASSAACSADVWRAGAALMGVVVAKLFLVDLSSIGSIERVVSFLGVGLLMLVIGWFAPVPPKAAETAR